MKKSILMIVFCIFGLLNMNAQKATNIQKRPHKTHMTATYYGNTYKTARHTANGDRFNMHAMTCAAPSRYKFGTRLKITNLANNKSVIVKVTDRGSFGNHTIDLTYAAFGKIANHRDGRVKIKVEVVS